MTALKLSPERTIAAMAREAFDGCGADLQAATDTMAKAVREDAAMYRRLLDPLVEGACYDAIRHVCRVERAATWAATGHADTGRRVVHLAGGNVASLMDFILPGGMRLRDANRDEIAAAAEFYSRQADDMAWKARWLQLIAAMLPGRKRVGQAFDEATILQLRREAER